MLLFLRSLDSMHAADLGVFQEALGSLMWLEATNMTWRAGIIGFGPQSRSVAGNAGGAGDARPGPVPIA